MQQKITKKKSNPNPKSCFQTNLHMQIHWYKAVPKLHSNTRVQVRLSWNLGTRNLNSLHSHNPLLTKILYTKINLNYYTKINLYYLWFLQWDAEGKKALEKNSQKHKAWNECLILSTGSCLHLISNFCFDLGCADKK